MHIIMVFFQLNTHFFQGMLKAFMRIYFVLSGPIFSFDYIFSFQTSNSRQYKDILLSFSIFSIHL